MFYRAAALAVPLFISACASTIDPHEVRPHVAPLQGSPIVDVSTDYTDALSCVANHAQRQSFPAPRIAVGHISDLTGADDALTGRRLTQGATLMAISAITKAGMRVVERYDLGVVQVELDYASNGLLRDAPGVLRKPKAGQVEGADLYIVGGITEYNPNIRSAGKHGYLGGNDDPGGAISVGKNEYIVDVGIDLRIIDARSTEVLGVRAFRKQIRGTEVEAGVFSFFGGTVVDIGGGQRALEPVQTAVRSMIERSVYEFLQDLYGFDSAACGIQTDTYAAPQQAHYTPATAAASTTSKASTNASDRRILRSTAQQTAYGNQQRSTAPSVAVQSEAPGVLERGTYVIKIGAFQTYASAVSSMAQLNQYLPGIDQWPHHVSEAYSPYNHIEYTLNVMEGATQSQAVETCKNIQTVGYGCEVHAAQPTRQTASLPQSNSHAW